MKRIIIPEIVSINKMNLLCSTDALYRINIPTSWSKHLNHFYSNVHQFNHLIQLQFNLTKKTHGFNLMSITNTPCLKEVINVVTNFYTQKREFDIIIVNIYAKFHYFAHSSTQKRYLTVYFLRKKKKHKLELETAIYRCNYTLKYQSICKCCFFR